MQRSDRLLRDAPGPFMGMELWSSAVCFSFLRPYIALLRQNTPPGRYLAASCRNVEQLLAQAEKFAHNIPGGISYGKNAV
ncbi:hypothetical protein RB195_003783 [Necator americanus]|uniref:Uncharacterized protein n=1 Tax=Necator americanus TaxID=51031 RepID=A0ABR1DQ48_NECAM